MQIKIAPSLQAADLRCLREVVLGLERAGVDGIHVDVADGHFAPNLIFGPPFTAAVSRCARVPVGVHLMVTDPAAYGPTFIDAGADVVMFHAEATGDPVGVARLIRGLGAQPGGALKPETPPEALEGLVGEIDCIMVMTVEPGFSGQSFMPSACGKIPELRRMFGSSIDIYVDGGLGPETVGTAVGYGANVIVASAAVFRTDVPPAEAVRRLRQAALEALD